MPRWNNDITRKRWEKPTYRMRIQVTMLEMQRRIKKELETVSHVMLAGEIGVSRTTLMKFVDGSQQVQLWTIIKIVQYLDKKDKEGRDV